ncbi:MAG: ABC transporter substrate-binding protein [Thermodesulfobacteriota bacterium]
MNQRKKGLKCLVFLSLAFLLTGVLPWSGTAAPAKKTTSGNEFPVTAKEWMAQTGLDWGPKYWPTKPVRGGVFNSASPLYIGLMNPHHWPVNDWVTIGVFYEKLIYTDGKFRPAVPWLAESWKYLNDVTVIMKLRQGVYFHDGSPFNAESLKYQMEWIMDPKNGAWTRSWLEPVASIEVVDTYTVKWNFKRPWAGFLGMMSYTPGYVISAKALKADTALKEMKNLTRLIEREKKNAEQAEKEAAAATGEAVEKAKAKLETIRKKLSSLEEDYKKAAALAEGAKELDNNPVGTGPFMLEEGNPGNYLKLKRNPNWWFGKFIGRPEMPYYDGIKVNVIPDPSVRLANLRAGKLDSMYIESSQYPMVKNDRNLKVFVYPGTHLVAMRFNMKDGPCKDIRVRKAISHALDRKALIAGVTFGLGRPASCMYPSDHWAHNPNLKPVHYDPELSKKLLTQAGFKKGLTIKGFMGNTASSVTTAEAIKAMLAKVGITWNVDLLDPAAISEKLRKVDYDFAAGGWAWIFDPDQMPTGLYHPDGGFNFGRSNNPKAIALIEAARKELDLQKRTKIYWELEKVVYDNYEDAWLWYPMDITIYRKNVEGWNMDMYLKNRESQYYSHPGWFKGGKEGR